MTVNILLTEMTAEEHTNAVASLDFAHSWLAGRFLHGITGGAVFVSENIV